MDLKNKYQTLFYSSPDPVFIESLDGFILDANKAALDMHGVSREALIGKNFTEFVPSSHQKRIRSNVKNFIEDQIRIFESFAINKHQVEIPIEITASVIDYGGQQAILIHVRDISKRKLIEQELKNSHLQLRNLSRHLQNIREIESTKIARELHDILGQDLTALKFDIAYLKRKIAKIEGNIEVKTELENKFGTMLELTASTLNTVRKITSNLRPTVLDDIGLAPALDWLINDFKNRTAIEAVVETRIQQPISQPMSITIYRIIQESLTNVIRHANATEVQVFVIENKNSIDIKVIDNGRGITPPQVKRTQSFGIIGIKERVLSHSGTFEIFGCDGKGTSVCVTLPKEND